MEIKVLGTGCPKCKSLEQKVINALAEMDVAASVEKVEDIMKILEYGVMSTPGLVINGKVVYSGGIPSTSKIKEFITLNL